MFGVLVMLASWRGAVWMRRSTADFLSSPLPSTLHSNTFIFTQRIPNAAVQRRTHSHNSDTTPKQAPSEGSKVSSGGGSHSGRGAIEDVESLIGSDIIDDIIRSRPVREKVNLVSRSKKSWEERVGPFFRFLGKPLLPSPEILPLSQSEMEAVLSTDSMEVDSHFPVL